MTFTKYTSMTNGADNIIGVYSTIIIVFISISVIYIYIRLYRMRAVSLSIFQNFA